MRPTMLEPTLPAYEAGPNMGRAAHNARSPRLSPVIKNGGVGGIRTLAPVSRPSV